MRGPSVRADERQAADELEPQAGRVVLGEEVMVGVSLEDVEGAGKVGGLDVEAVGDRSSDGAGDGRGAPCGKGHREAPLRGRPTGLELTEHRER